MPRRPALDDQSGFTLVELLVTCSMMLVILGATLSLLESGTRAHNRDQQYALAINDGQVGLSRMMHEIREATNVVGEANYVDLDVKVAGVAKRVYYQCDVPQAGTTYNKCVRLQAAQGAALPPTATGTPVILRVKNGALGHPVFSFTPNQVAPNYVDAMVELPAAGELSTSQGLRHSIVLHSGAYLRNLDVGA